jgi:hypothetical protein
MNIRLLSIGLVGLAVMSNTADSAPVKRYAARITVKGELEKERDSSKNESEKNSTKTKTEKQHYELAITAANTGKQGGTFDLECYFFKRQLDDKGNKGDPVLCEKDKATLTLGGMKRAMHKVTSETLSWEESKSSKSSSGKSNSSKSSSGKSISGEVYGGYIVLLRAEGEIIAKYSSDKKFLSKEWLSKLDQPVSSGSGSSSRNKKKKKK